MVVFPPAQDVAILGETGNVIGAGAVEHPVKRRAISRAVVLHIIVFPTRVSSALVE